MLMYMYVNIYIMCMYILHKSCKLGGDGCKVSRMYDINIQTPLMSLLKTVMSTRYLRTRTQQISLHKVGEKIP